MYKLTKLWYRCRTIAESFMQLFNAVIAVASLSRQAHSPGVYVSCWKSLCRSHLCCVVTWFEMTHFVVLKTCILLVDCLIDAFLQAELHRSCTSHLDHSGVTLRRDDLELLAH